MKGLGRVAASVYVGLVLAVAATGAGEDVSEAGFERLFAKDGVPAGWVVRRWDDVSKPAEPHVVWTVREGVLQGSEPRGTWLMSEREYGDFVLRFEFKLGTRGNSGCALRSPLSGDPAFDGLELQMLDPRYTTNGLKDSELTGAIYRAIAPRRQVFKPTEWNEYDITMQGSKLRIVLNGEVLHDLDLSRQTQGAPRHDGSLASAIKDRPRRGHIGFQELSRGGDHVQIRNARIKERP
jgi:hypothetical protein